MEDQKPTDLQPGQVITPHVPEEAVQPTGAPEPDRTPDPMPEEPVPAAPSDPGSQSSTTATSTSEPALVPQTNPPEAGWSYQEETDPATLPPTDLPEQLSWTAAEFVAHDKGTKWYMALALAGVVAAGLDFLVTKDIFSTIIILIAAMLFGVYAGHKPREQQYALDHQGILVGSKIYDFQAYKTFSVVDEGAAASVVFMPLKRFMPPLTIYLTPEIEDQVVDYLSAFLPFEQHKADAVDNLMRRIRF